MTQDGELAELGDLLRRAPCALERNQTAVQKKQQQTFTVLTGYNETGFSSRRRGKNGFQSDKQKQSGERCGILSCSFKLTVGQTLISDLPMAQWTQQCRIMIAEPETK